ncbi:MAG: trehalose-6-phosphate synthase [Kofleriaceae bacterium]
MQRVARFVVASVVGLAGLSAVAYWILGSVLGAWIEKDLRMRARLAVASAEVSLVQGWEDGPGRLSDVLTAITRDDRIMGAAACTAGGELRAATDAYPQDFQCSTVSGMVARSGQQELQQTVDHVTGSVHLSALPLHSGDKVLGTIVLVQDLSFASRRNSVLLRFMLATFFVLAVLGAGVILIARRFAWRGWTLDMRRSLVGTPSREFQPLVKDVRNLIEQLAEDRDREAHVGPWTPERLRSTLTHHLHGEQVVILANREPYIHERTDDGVRVVHPASGLVTALEPVMRACKGVWVAHGAGTADRETVDAHDRVRVPPGEESYVVRRVWLTPEEERGYYYGFANEGLWPLCHVADTRPTFRSEDWDHYVKVNQRFADAVCDETQSDDPIVLVQDYHFSLAPRMIRERLPRATILAFWHVPWPSAERIDICPWREQIVEGLLGSSIIGFHTQQHCNNFMEAVDAFLESRIDREHNAIIQGPRRTLVRAYPISIEWPVRWLAGLPSVSECRSLVREELGLPPDHLLGVGIDRLDYTKGVDERLQAVGKLLERHPEMRGRFTFVQLAAPSRTKIDRYRELNHQIEVTADRINEQWGTGRYRPIVLMRAHHEPPTVFRYYRAADLCYVSSLHDGMNLVAKEFVAARDDERGVLVLSQFTGASRDLTESLIVNPYDIAQAGDAMAVALKMPEEEQRERMRSMRRLVSEFNVYRWAGRMLVDASELRRRERLLGRLSSARANSGSDVA